MEKSFHDPVETTFDHPMDWAVPRIRERKLSYRFHTHFHPYVSELVERLVKGSVPALQAADTN